MGSCTIVILLLCNLTEQVMDSNGVDINLHIKLENVSSTTSSYTTIVRPSSIMPHIYYLSAQLRADYYTNHKQVLRCRTSMEDY